MAGYKFFKGTSANDGVEADEQKKEKSDDKAGVGKKKKD